MLEVFKNNKGKFISIGAILSTMAAAVAIWTTLGLPLLVWDYQLAHAGTEMSSKIEPVIIASRDYVGQKYYNLLREELEIKEKLVKLPPDAKEHRKLLEEVLRSNKLRQIRLKELDDKLKSNLND